MGFVVPCNIKTATPFRFYHVQPFMCYPYFHLFYSDKHDLIDVSGSYETQVPVQYLYGAKKRVMFHSESYLQYLQSRSDCRYKCFNEDGHWLHWTSPDAVANEIKEFLA